MTISSFRGVHRFLSNFYMLDNALYIPSEYGTDNLPYPSVEHAYQAAKTLDFAHREIIAQYLDPASAKMHGRELKLREGWEDIKRPLMLRLVRQKFAINPVIRQRLIYTYPHDLVESNTWHDNYWGVCTCHYCSPGENWLGRILMFVREGYLIAG